MIIMLDADNTVIKTKELIKGTNRIEKIQRTVEGNYTLIGKEKLLTENENKPITRLTFIGHSSYDEEDAGVQCFGGYDAEDFSNLLIKRLEEANAASGKKKGFTNGLACIDLVGCLTGYISPNGKSFAGRVAERLLEAGFDIPVNAFTNRNLPNAKQIISMISMPSIEEGTLYIRGFQSTANQKKYEDMKAVISDIMEKRDYTACSLAEIKEKIIVKENTRQELKTKASVVSDKKEAMRSQYRSLKTELQDLIDSKDATNHFSTLKTLLATIHKKAADKGSKWQSQMSELISKIEEIDKSSQNELEKLKGAFELVNHTAKDIRGHFWGGSGSTTATQLEMILENQQSFLTPATEQVNHSKDATNHFGTLKTFLATIHKKAADKGSKWQSQMSELISKIEEINKSSRNEPEKLKGAFELVNHTAKDIRGHFWGGSGSTTATRLEMILEKQQSLLTQATKQANLNEKISKKTEELNQLRTHPEVDNLNKEEKNLRKAGNNLNEELTLLKKQEKETTQSVTKLNDQFVAAKKKMASFSVEIVRTDNIRGHLDSHPECNFTPSAKEKQSKMRPVNQDLRRVGFFQPPARTSSTATVASTLDVDIRQPK